MSPFVCLPPAVLAGEIVRSEMISSDKLNNSTGGSAKASIDCEDAKGRRAQSIRLATHSVTNVA